MDKLIVKGLGKLDGEYEFSLVEVLAVGRPESLTNRELHRIKVMSGIRAGEIEDSFMAGDSDLFAALAAVLLSRTGKFVDENALWDAQPASLTWDLEALREDEQEVPPAEPAETPATEKPSPSGGQSSSSTSDHQANGQSRTGLHALETSSAFDQLTSGT